MTFLAVWITRIFNPFFLFLGSFVVALYTLEISLNEKIIWFLLAFILACLPLAFLIWQRKKGTITSFWSPKLDERKGLFISWFASAVIFSLLAYQFNAPRFVLALSLVQTLLAAFNLILSSSIKVSIHMEAAALFVLTLILGLSVAYFYTILLLPLLGWARVYLRAHSLSEVNLATLSTIVIVYLIFSLFGLATF